MSGETRFVRCDACGSEGRLLTSNGGPYDTDHGPCPYCNGTGMEEIEVEPVALDDLIELYESMPAREVAERGQ